MTWRGNQREDGQASKPPERDSADENGTSGSLASAITVGAPAHGCAMTKGTGPARCTKWRYRSRVDALLALARIQYRDSSNRDKQEQRAYRCTRCFGWHLTSRPKSSE